MSANADVAEQSRKRQYGSKTGKRLRKGSKADLRQRTYTSWNNMLQRCYNPKHVSYPEYGKRGISVHFAWRPVAPNTPGPYEGTLVQERTRAQAFANFLADMGIKPTWKHTLDRISAHEHYTPSNCRWATPKEQGINKRDTHFVLHPSTGERIAAASLADEIGIRYQALRARMMKAGTWYQLRDQNIPNDRILKPGEETN